MKQLNLKLCDFETRFNIYFTKRVPYDWRTPTGYLWTVLIQFILGIFPIRFYECFALLPLGGLILSFTVVKILKNELRSIRNMARHRECRRSMYKKMSKFIQIHAETKQLSKWQIEKWSDLAINTFENFFSLFTCRLLLSYLDFYDFTMTIVFLNCIINMCATLLLVQIEIVEYSSQAMAIFSLKMNYFVFFSSFELVTRWNWSDGCFGSSPFWCLCTYAIVFCLWAWAGAFEWQY